MTPDFRTVIWRHFYRQTDPSPLHQHEAPTFIQLEFESAST